MYSRPMTADAALIRLGELVEQRINELGLHYRQVAQGAGFSDETLSKIRKGVAVRTATYRALERAVFWEVGSVDAVLEGGRPTSLDGPQRAAAESTSSAAPVEEPADPRVGAIMTILDGLPARVQAEVLLRLGERVPGEVRAELESGRQPRKAS